SPFALPFRIQVDAGAVAVVGGIFHQVHQYLLNQNGVHGDEQRIVRGSKDQMDLRKTLLEFGSYAGKDLFGYFQFFADTGGGVSYAGNGQQIFHHTDQPLGFTADISQQGRPLLWGEDGVIFQHSGDRTHDGG